MISLEMVGYFDSTPGTQRLPHGVRGLLPDAPDAADFYALTGKAYAKAWVQRVDAGLRPRLRTPLLTLVLPTPTEASTFRTTCPTRTPGSPPSCSATPPTTATRTITGRPTCPHADYDRMADLTSALAQWLRAPDPSLR